MAAAPRTVEEVYGSAFAEHEAFEEALGRSLEPRGFELLFDLVAELGLPPGSTAVDVGCREAYHCVELLVPGGRANEGGGVSGHHYGRGH